MRWLKWSLRSVRSVEEKAASHLPTKSGALGPDRVMTIVEEDLPTLAFSVVSHRGCPVRANTVLKVDRSVVIEAKE